MTPTGAVDAASCAALSADLLRGARLLRDSVAPPPARPDEAAGASATGGSPRSLPLEVVETADAMETLGHALRDFADAVRRGRHPGPGLPLPRTALRAAARDVVARLTPETNGRPAAGGVFDPSTTPLP